MIRVLASANVVATASASGPVAITQPTRPQGSSGGGATASPTARVSRTSRSTRRGAGEGTDQLSPADAEALVDRSLAGYFSHQGVFGTVDYAATRADELAGIGVDEMACLIDFGVADELALASVRRIAELNREFNGEPS